VIAQFLWVMIRPFFTLYAFSRYHDIWRIKEVIKKKRHRLLEHAYYDYFAARCSWISHHSNFLGVPFFPHGPLGVFISRNAVIGKNCVIMQQVTIGSNPLADSKLQGSPVIGDNVFIGAGAKIVGGIRIGNNCRIGANVTISGNLPENTLAVCSTPRSINISHLDNLHFLEADGNRFCCADGKWVREECDS